MLRELLSGLKWINWLNTHGGWSETTTLSPPFNYLWSLPPTLRCSETSGYISPLWKLAPPFLPFAPREPSLHISQVSLRIRKPRRGIFPRILHVTAVSIALDDIQILWNEYFSPPPPFERNFYDNVYIYMLSTTKNLSLCFTTFTERKIAWRGSDSRRYPVPRYLSIKYRREPTKDGTKGQYFSRAPVDRQPPPRQRSAVRFLLVSRWLAVHISLGK